MGQNACYWSRWHRTSLDHCHQLIRDKKYGRGKTTAAFHLSDEIQNCQIMLLMSNYETGQVSNVAAKCEG